MGLKNIGAAAAAAAALLVLNVGSSAPAQAQRRPVDPERVSYAPSPHRGVSPSATLASSIDSDAYVYALSPSASTYFMAAGRLQLRFKSGSTTKYTGSFLDYDGAKAYSASADTTNSTNPTLSIKTRNGTFKFVMDTNFGGPYYSSTSATSVPSKASRSNAYFYASPHATTTKTFSLEMNQRFGPLAKQFSYTGTLVVNYDANGRVSGGSITALKTNGTPVTSQIKSTGYFSTSGYVYFIGKVMGRQFGFAGTYSGSTITGNAFTTSGRGSGWVWSATP